MTPEIAFSPRIQFVPQADLEQILAAALQILEETGMRILHEDALALLKGAGCNADGDGRVTFPSALVERMLTLPPDNIRVYDRNGEPAMDLGGRRSYFGSGSDLLNAMDSDTGERRPCVLADVARAARVCDALPNIDFVMSFAHPTDVPIQHAYLKSVEAMAVNTVKPLVCTSEKRRDLAAMRDIAVAVRGGDASALADRPYLVHYAEPISPLVHPFDSLDKLLFCAKNRIPVVYSPAPIAGATAPITVAGHVAQGLAESFCGLVIHQLANEGAPFIMGMGPAVLDMATAQCSYNAPEYCMAYLTMVEMSNHLNLPNWGYAGTTDSQIADGQAVFEAGLLSFLSAMAGSNLNHDVGYIDFGRTGSLEMIVITDEIIDQIRRFQEGTRIGEDRLALSVIADVGPGGQFLDHPHTFENMRAEQWRPRLLNRYDYGKWQETGGGTLTERAKTALARILKDHTPPALPDDTRQRITAVVEGYTPV